MTLHGVLFVEGEEQDNSNAWNYHMPVVLNRVDDGGHEPIVSGQAPMSRA